MQTPLPVFTTGQDEGVQSLWMQDCAWTILEQHVPAVARCILSNPQLDSLFAGSGVVHWWHDLACNYHHQTPGTVVSPKYAVQYVGATLTGSEFLMISVMLIR